MAMQIFTLKRDGSGRKQITTGEATHWAPFPAPDGRHFVYVRVLIEEGGRPNYEIYLRSIETGEERRLTFDPGFDGFPSISADGRWMTFSSSRRRQAGRARPLPVHHGHLQPRRRPQIEGPAAASPGVRKNARSRIRPRYLTRGGYRPSISPRG